MSNPRSWMVLALGVACDPGTPGLGGGGGDHSTSDYGHPAYLDDMLGAGSADLLSIGMPETVGDVDGDGADEAIGPDYAHGTVWAASLAPSGGVVTGPGPGTVAARHASDLDGDGSDDLSPTLLVSELPSADPLPLGAVHYGPVTEDATTPDATFRFTASEAGDGIHPWTLMGRIQGGMDVTGDDVPDTVVTGLFYDFGESTPDPGWEWLSGLKGVYVIPGPVWGDINLDDVDSRIDLGDSWIQVQYSDVAGDVTGDGLVELITTTYGTTASGDGVDPRGLLWSQMGDVPTNLEDAGLIVEMDAGGIGPAGDENGDGYGDLWWRDASDVTHCVNRLVPGPLPETGSYDLRVLTLDTVEADMWYDEVGPLDADGDDFADFAVAGDDGPLFIMHGPIAGAMTFEEDADALIGPDPEGGLGWDGAWVADMDGHDKILTSATDGDGVDTMYLFDPSKI